MTRPQVFPVQTVAQGAPEPSEAVPSTPERWIHLPLSMAAYLYHSSPQGGRLATLQVRGGDNHAALTAFRDTNPQVQKALAV